MSEEEAAGVFQANDTIPVSVVAHRLGVAEQLLRRMLPESCRSAASISKDKIPACRESLGAADSCAILNHIALQRSKVLEDYFRQEGLMEDNNYGIVDLGWAGSLQSGIQKTLAHAGCSFRIRGFYLGLWGNTPADLDAEAYAFDYRGCETPPVSWFVSLAELFSQANHGSTLGFKSNEQGFIAPILDEIDSDNLLVPGWLEIHRRVVLSFMSIVISSNAFTITPSSLVRLLRCHLQRYYFFPSKTEAEAWGACRFSSHGVASSREPIAPFPKTLRDMLWIIGIQRFGTGNAIWPHAAAARLPRPLAECARLIHRVLFHMRAVYW
jgi:hypothetical protein